jgi:hypothetical protein
VGDRERLVAYGAMTRGGPGYTHKRECRCDAIARASIYRSVERIVGQAFGHSAVEVGAGGSGKQRISGCSPGLGGDSGMQQTWGLFRTATLERGILRCRI